MPELRHRWFLPPLFLLALLLEGGALYMALEHGCGLAAALHTGAALVFVMPAVLLKGHPTHLNPFRFFSALAGCLTFFLPVMGIAGCAAAYAAIRWLLKPKGLVEDYEQFTEYTLQERFFGLSDEDPRTLLTDELSIEPVLDILAGDDEDLKRGALNMLGRMGTSKAVRLLKRCLTDPSPDVRFYAHSTLTKLDETYVARIKEARQRVKDGGEHPAHNLLELGKAYTAYAYSGLLEEETRNHYLTLARSAYDDGLKKGPSDPDLLMQLGRIRMETGDLRGAAECFERGLKTEQTRVESFLGLCRIFYDRGDMKTVAKLVQHVDLRKKWQTKDPNQAYLFQFWADPRTG